MEKGLPQKQVPSRRDAPRRLDFRGVAIFLEELVAFFGELPRSNVHLTKTYERRAGLRDRRRARPRRPRATTRVVGLDFETIKGVRDGSSR